MTPLVLELDVTESCPSFWGVFRLKPLSVRFDKTVPNLPGGR